MTRLLLVIACLMATVPAWADDTAMGHIGVMVSNIEPAAGVLNGSVDLKAGDYVAVPECGDAVKVDCIPAEFKTEKQIEEWK